MIKWLNAKGRHKIVFLTVFSLLVTSVDIASRDANPKVDLNGKRRRTLSQSDPIVEYTAHNRGNIQLAIANNGTLGTLGGSIPDPFTGDAIPSCIYPKNSNIVFLWVAALWIGAVVGRDTLVSCANEDWYRTTEFWPDIKPFGDFQYKSMDEASAFFSEDAFSEEDIICSYTDTVTDPNLVEMDPTDARPHKPLGVKISQRSMSWSYSYADDFILFDYKIENIGREILKDVYMGIYLDGDVWHVTRNGPEGWNDDMVGFYRTHPVEGDCGFIDTVNVAWHADNDGDPVNHSRWDERSARGVLGLKVIRTPSDSLRYSYNWWIINYGDATRDFGPRRKGTPDDPYRDFGPRMGTPSGDRNKYYVLRHEEFDYDLLATAVDHTDEGWLPPPEEATDFARGYDTRHLLSFGPFDVNPGEKLPISFALVGGENFHRNASDFDVYHDPYNPDRYYNTLDFSALAQNLTWASWVYDNPGVDTDGDDYYGKYRVCCYDTSEVEIDTIIGGVDTTISRVVYGRCDTTFYEGDGVPDFRGASPPPAPVFWVLPRVGSLRVRFNGLHSETARDQFSDLADFEGYRVYLARDERPGSFSMIASYDKDNYNKWVWDDGRLPEPGYVLLDPPFTREELRCLYGESCSDALFEPLQFTRARPYIHKLYPDSIFYFEAQDFNASIPNLTTPIKKIYPDQTYPSSLNTDSVSVDELTADGYLKYFEYELTVDNLLPTVPYWVNVTAFDFGSPKSGLGSLETPLVQGARVAYPSTAVDEVEDNSLEVFVYPNPYRIDENYEDNGFENRGTDLAQDRARRIHFANLPRVCTISIYSLDGDLVRRIDHSFPEGGPEAMHDTWDLITRNTQAAVSGLYYFVVESEFGTQIGKLVIIK